VVADTPAQGGRLEIDVSNDPSDPAAQGIRLVELTVDDRTEPGPSAGPSGA